MDKQNNKEIVKKKTDWKKLKDDQFKNEINTYKNSIVIPEKDEKNKSNEENIDMITIKKTIPLTQIINKDLKLNITFDKLYKNKTDLNDKLKKTEIYYLKPTTEQQNILLFWFDLYIFMYNKVLEIVKDIRKKENKKQNKIVKLNELDLNLDLTNLKKELEYYKEELKNKINPKTNKKSNINSHILDYAIKDAITSVKSIISNLNNNHIKNTKLRYLKTTKNKKIIKIEKQICQSESFCSSVIGGKMLIEPKLKFTDITEVATLQYDKRRNSFKFLIKKTVEMEKEKEQNKKIIALDPGFRTLLTGISNDHIIEIGINPLEGIKNTITKLNKIKKKKKIKNKKRTLMKYEDKINNYITNMQNKIVNKITKEYDEILIGNMSTKSIVEQDTIKKIKQDANMLKIYQLREKLKNKCIKRNKKYKLINEYDTSKCCSNCGNKKMDLGDNKIYNCEKCNKNYDRDVNASKNILLKGLIKSK
jgi:putative transposase